MEKIIALYERLSREDENLGESYSISNQKKLLEDYCREKGWTRFSIFQMTEYQELHSSDRNLRL